MGVSLIVFSLTFFTENGNIEADFDPFSMQEFESKRKAIEERDLLKIRLAMGHEKSTS